MKVIKLLVNVFVAALIACSLMPYMPAFSSPLIDLPSHFVAHYTLAALALLPLVGFWRMPKTAVVLLFVLLLNFWQLHTQLMPMPPAPPRGMPLKILQTNTLYLNKNTEKLKALIAAERPDLIVASETNHEFAAMFKTIEKEYPHQALHPQGDNPRGLALLSKIPFTKQDKVYYVKDKIPSQVFTIEYETRKIRFISVHPSTPLHGGLDNRDDIFRNIFRKMEKEAPENLVILGDFNATPWCPALKKLTVDLGLENSRNGKGLLPSWPTTFPRILRLPIDHVLVSSGLTATAHRLLPDIGSDHLPSLVEVGIRK